jgi:recombination protein RecT
MSNLTTKDFFDQSSVKKRFEDLLGKRSTSFITSVLQIVNSNDLLKNADPASVYNAAATAATLDLPLNNSLGFAYIVPFNDRKANKQLATFQLGYRAYIQLAQRSGQFKTISATAIYKGQVSAENPLTGFEFNFSAKESDEIIGYAAYFKLLNGFEKTIYMTKEELEKHGKKYSQTFKNGFGLWKDNFEAMAIKTVLKLILSKFAPLSVDMQTAIITDQAVIKNTDTMEVEYVDNTQPTTQELQATQEIERIMAHINKAQTLEDLDDEDFVSAVYEHSLIDALEAKKEELKTTKK